MKFLNFLSNINIRFWNEKIVYKVKKLIVIDSVKLNILIYNYLFLIYKYN